MMAMMEEEEEENQQPKENEEGGEGRQINCVLYTMLVVVIKITICVYFYIKH